MSDESDNFNELLLETIHRPDQAPRSPLEQFAEMVRYMGGVCAVNLTEPSEGDLKRLADAYHELFKRCYDVSLERDVLAAEKIAHLQLIDGLSAQLEEARETVQVMSVESTKTVRMANDYITKIQRLERALSFAKVHIKRTGNDFIHSEIEKLERGE